MTKQDNNPDGARGTSPGRRERRPSPEEAALFEAAMRRGSVRERSSVEKQADPAAPPKPNKRTDQKLKQSQEPVGTGIDRRTEQRLRRGQMKIDARLDLHGLYQDAAHRALLRFIDASIAADRRCVLIITGKGGSGSADDRQRGVLRANVPRWLMEPRVQAKIISVLPARQRDGGDGAFYVLLRRRDRLANGKAKR